ncbi:hypothetical protein B7759_04590 [Burkholderia glumae]|nr:hypothetical protein KS03_5040 [Burkholderia glumae LMG 2196 = ATCC 33617]QKM56902.1 hypothetical protein CG017_04969 [Burkholderia glumae]QTP35955.1 hypothetical protein B7759_04590 [Burkholderia glumae]
MVSIFNAAPNKALLIVSTKKPECLAKNFEGLSPEAIVVCVNDRGYQGAAFWA